VKEGKCGKEGPTLNNHLEKVPIHIETTPEKKGHATHLTTETDIYTERHWGKICEMDNKSQRQKSRGPI